MISNGMVIALLPISLLAVKNVLSLEIPFSLIELSMYNRTNPEPGK
jgi:hypothetical protein